jgi:hypothetical protein
MSSASPIVHLRDIQKRPRILDVLERKRNRFRVFWLIEFFAEMVRLKCDDLSSSEPSERVVRMLHVCLPG